MSLRAGGTADLPGDDQAAEQPSGPTAAADAQPPPPVAGGPARDDTASDPLAERVRYLHRRVVKISPARIEVRPPRSALILPLVGVLITGGLLALVAVATEDLPFWVLPVILVVSVALLPLSGLSLVYAVFGANIVADRAGNNVSLKQRFLGLGVGTNELIPFWKIREFLVEDVARAVPGPEADVPAHEIAQWQLTLVKKSGRRHAVGSFSVPRDREEEGLDLVMDVAEAFAVLSGVPLRGPIW